MCWSGEASAVLAITGFATAGYVAYKGEPRPLWVALGYFSLMEALQAYTYGVINKCEAPSNQVATLLGYLHIAFQPFFINMLALYFIPQKIAHKLEPVVYGACLFTVIVMIIQVFPFDWAGHCIPGDPLCSNRLCSVSGSWHIAWDVPLNGISDNFMNPGLPVLGQIYVLAAFVMPILYGSWRLTLFQFTLGPILASLTTTNMNEWPAVWCLLSIGILMIAVKSPLRNKLHVKKWFLWPRKWLA